MRIRSIEKKDLNEMFNLCSMPELSCLPDCSYPTSVEGLQHFFENSALDDSEKHFAIVNADDEFKGLVCLRHINSKFSERNIRMECADMNYLPADFSKKNPDNLILSIAVKFRNQNPVLLTSDNGFQVKAKGLGIPTIKLKNFLR